MNGYYKFWILREFVTYHNSSIRGFLHSSLAAFSSSIMSGSTQFRGLHATFTSRQQASHRHRAIPSKCIPSKLSSPTSLRLPDPTCTMNFTPGWCADSSSLPACCNPVTSRLQQQLSEASQASQRFADVTSGILGINLSHQVSINDALQHTSLTLAVCASSTVLGINSLLGLPFNLPMLLTMLYLCWATYLWDHLRDCRLVC